jgi:hypothetical protein
MVSMKRDVENSELMSFQAIIETCTKLICYNLIRVYFISRNCFGDHAWQGELTDFQKLILANIQDNVENIKEVLNGLSINDNEELEQQFINHMEVDMDDVFVDALSESLTFVEKYDNRVLFSKIIRAVRREGSPLGFDDIIDTSPSKLLEIVTKYLDIHHLDVEREWEPTSIVDFN